MKIKSIKFTNHPILGNLLLDFCDLSGNPVDTVIIAGENGTGKSTLLNEIYDILTGNIHCDVLMKAEIGGREVSFKYFLKSLGSGQFIWSLMVGNTNVSISSNPHKAHFAAIFSDVDIHFTSEPISSVMNSKMQMKQIQHPSSQSCQSALKIMRIGAFAGSFAYM